MTSMIRSGHRLVIFLPSEPLKVDGTTHTLVSVTAWCSHVLPLLCAHRTQSPVVDFMQSVAVNATATIPFGSRMWPFESGISFASAHAALVSLPLAVELF